MVCYPSKDSKQQDYQIFTTELSMQNTHVSSIMKICNLQSIRDQSNRNKEKKWGGGGVTYGTEENFGGEKILANHVK